MTKNLRISLLAPLAGWMLAAPMAAPVAAADLALVISNETYDGLSRVDDLSQRAERRIVSAYRRAGYEVMSGRNLNDAELRALLVDFQSRMGAADNVVIHYGGHLAASERNLWLVPTNLANVSQMELGMRSASLELLYDVLDNKPGEAALVLAAPMENLREAIGWGPRIGNGVLLIAGAPRAMSRALPERWIDGQQSARQLSKRRDMLVAGFVSDQPFFADPEPEVMAPEPQNTGSTMAVQDMSDWRAAANANTRQALEAYITAHPNGMFVNEARARLDALAPQISVEEQIERDLNLTRAERRQIQSDLTLLGYSTRGVDGIFGAGSRRAITQWQTDERFRASGFLDRGQIRLLRSAAAARQEELDRQAAAEREAQEQADLDYWRQTGISGREADLQAYLARFPEGLFASQARRLLVGIEADRASSVNAEAEAREQRMGMNDRTRLLVEQRLAGLGLNPGPADGRFDADTRRAISQFQQQRGLEVTGYLDNKTVGQLVASVFR